MKRALKSDTRFKTPQQKKYFSYLRDGRTSFGENDKASRRAIPRRKAWARRALRRKMHLLMQVDPFTPQFPVRVDSHWKKAVDLPLIVDVVEKLMTREAKGGFRSARAKQARFPKVTTLGHRRDLLGDIGGETVLRELRERGPRAEQRDYTSQS